MARADASAPPDSRIPSRADLAWLALRVAGLRLRRSMIDLTHPVPRLTVGDASSELPVVACHRSPLFVARDPRERKLELGKVQNLRVAARALDGLWIPAGEAFSFWRQVGRCTSAKGYVAGRQLQEGCLVPAVGGGICQLSNALYDVALQAGCEILERHPHTRIVPGSAASQDRDATVAWNHIDLRWRSSVDLRLTVRLTAEELVVELRGRGAVDPAPKPRRTLRQWIDPGAHSCGTCDQTGCHLFAKGIGSLQERTAVLVDEVWPEFDGFLNTWRREGNELFVPLDGLRRERANYAWSTDGFDRVHEAMVATLRRSIRSRRLAHQGPARQIARLRSFEELANAYGRRLPLEATHLIVSQELLPFLWQAGYLGGRTFDVLMTRFPMEELQRRLDGALARHPERRLLGDFRAPGDLVAAELEALAAARHLVTPHRAVMAGDDRKVLLDWEQPSPKPWQAGNRVVFPGPAVARKGAYEVRGVAAKLGLAVVCLGRNLEGDGFWEGIRTEPADGFWLDGALAVVQPAVLEDRPKRLLQAIACGCPVIATEACGVSGLPGVRLVPEGDETALEEAVREVLTSRGGTASASRPGS